MGGTNGDDDDETMRMDVENLDEMELRTIAEKVLELLRRDLLIERERRGLDERWGGWRQS
jgi:hypothetical protein